MHASSVALFVSSSVAEINVKRHFSYLYTNWLGVERAAIFFQQSLNFWGRWHWQHPKMGKISFSSTFIKRKQRIHFDQRDKVSEIRLFYISLGGVSRAKQLMPDFIPIRFETTNQNQRTWWTEESTGTASGLWLQTGADGELLLPIVLSRTGGSKCYVSKCHCCNTFVY